VSLPFLLILHQCLSCATTHHGEGLPSTFAKTGIAVPFQNLLAHSKDEFIFIADNT
jgi:hypothetical protein